MAKLVVEEIIIPKALLTGLDREIPADKDSQRAIGLAAHYILERLEFRDNEIGETIVRDILADIKAAMGVRAPRNPIEEDGPQPVGRKKRAKKPDDGKPASKKKPSKRRGKKSAAPEDGAETTDETATEGTAEGATEGTEGELEGTGDGGATFQDEGTDEAAGDDAVEAPEESDSQADAGAAQTDEVPRPGPQLADPFANDN